MTNLIPEVRVDKNGRKTTRWVKPELSRSAATKGIPRVSSEGIQAQSELVRLLNKGQYPRDGLSQAVTKSITGKTAQRLVDFLNVPRTDAETRELQRAVTMNIENPRIGKPLNELLVRHYDNARAARISGIEDFLTGINDMPRILTTEQEWALLKVTYAASHAGDTVQRVNVPFPFDAYAIANEELVDYVIENPERADDIATIIAERKIEDVTTIDGLLNGGTHDALKHGTL